MRRKSRFLGVIAGCALAAGALAVAGCGSSDSGSDSGSSGISSAVQTQWDQYMSAKGVGYKQPPSTSPKPAQDKSIWILSCGQSIPSCSYPAAQTAEAAKLLGWKSTIYDTKLDPARINEGYRQAIAAGADGVASYSMDCSISKAGLVAAQKAKVPTVAAEALENCGDGKNYFSDIVAYTQGPFVTWWGKYGAAQADNVIVGTKAKAKVITINQVDFPMMMPTLKGFKAQLAKECSSCEVVEEIEFTTPDIGAKLQAKVEQALVRNPTANSLYVVYDMLALGPDGAIRTSNRSKDIFVATAEGQASTMDNLRSGKIQGAGVGIPQGWEAFATVDTLNRLMQGEKQAPSGMGLQSYDLDHNFPSTGRWEPPIDYKAAYKKAWGVQ